MASGHDVQKHYYEYRALFTLQKLYPQEYGTLIHGDKPDLSDDGKNAGIEVVRGADIQWEKHSSYFQKHLKDRMIGEIPKQKIGWFTANGYEITTRGDLGLKPAEEIVGYIPETRWINTSNLERVIKQKIEYIDKTNWRVSQLSLYIFSDFFKMYERGDIEKLVRLAQEQQEKKNNQYRLLYVDDCGWFYRCDLSSGQIDFIDTDEILHEICVRAKAHAEDSIL